MIKTVADFLENVAKHDSDTYFIYIDGFQHPWVTNLKELYPDRVISCGISESNAISVATGLAQSGKTVYIFMISAYACKRALDQLKFAAYCNSNIKIITALSGIAVPYAGYSHTAVDDVAILRNTPNLKIFKPCCIKEIEHIIQNTYKEKGPCYIGIDNRGAQPQIEYTEYGRITISHQGKNKDLCILYTGFAGSFIRVEDFLRLDIDPSIYSVYLMEPFNEEEILNLIKNYKYVITVEFQGKGSLTSSVAEIIAKNGLKTKLLPKYLKDEKYTTMGSAQFVGEKYLKLSSLAQDALKFIGRRKSVFFRKKRKVFENAIKTKYKFLGITYFKTVQRGEKIKKYLFGFIKI